MTSYNTVGAIVQPFEKVVSTVISPLSDATIRKGLIFAVIILVILYLIWTQPWRVFPDNLVYISGFPSWDVAQTYIEDPEASEDVKMKRVVFYSLVSSPCGGDKQAIMNEASKVVDLLKAEGCKSVEYLHQWLLRVWNDCVDITTLQSELKTRFAQFKGYRLRLPPPYVDATMLDLKNMLYVYNSFSPFFVDCSRSINPLPAQYRTYLQSEQSCRSSCGVEPNYSPNVWRRDKFATLEEAERYIGDKGISERCRVVRAALLIPLVKLNQNQNELQSKAVIEDALYNSGELVLQSIRTVRDLDNFVHGIATSIGWKYDIDTIRRLMYTTEYGTPVRANSLQHMFQLATSVLKFSDAPKVEAEGIIPTGADVYRDSAGNPMYLDASGVPHYPNEKDDAGNPVYVEGGVVHDLTSSPTKKPVFVGLDGEPKYPNVIDSNGYPAYLDANGIYNYYDTNAKDMEMNNIVMKGYAYDAMGKVVSERMQNNRYLAVTSDLRR